MRKRVFSWALVLLLLFGMLSSGIRAEEAPAASVTVYMTVSSQGVLAKTADGSVMANREVTVQDVNGDGIFSYNEALKAAHEQYNSADGYRAEEGAYGLSVTRVWGIDSYNCVFYTNHTALSVNVGEATVSQGDYLVASINQDNQYYSDHYTYFDTNAKTVNAGEEFSLTLRSPMYAGTSGVPDVMISTQREGSEMTEEAGMTDAQGTVSLSFAEPGTYYVSASGTIQDDIPDYTQTPDENWNYPTIKHDCPIIAPVCVVTVRQVPSIVSAVLTDENGMKLTETDGVYLVPDNVKTVLITIDCQDAEVTINGNAAVSQETYSFVPVYDENGECGIEVIAYYEESNQVRVEYVLRKSGIPETVPVILEQPKDQEWIQNADAENALMVTIQEVNPGDTVTYSWYQCEEKKAEGGTLLESSVSEDGRTSFCTPATDEIGNRYYYCLIIKTAQDGSVTMTYSEVATVSVTRDDFEGEGDEEHPYLLSTAEDLEKLYDLVAAGKNMEGMYFRMTADIVLEADWKSIGIQRPGTSNTGKGKNILPFSGVFDGGGHTLTVAKGGQPLFGYVREATVKNLNIYGEYIAEDGLVANYTVDYGADGSYGSGCPHVIDIENVTIKSGTVIRGNGLLGGYASGSNTVNIVGCTVETGVKIGWDAETDAPVRDSYLGSLAGQFNGTVTNCVSYADVYGVEGIGGLVGGKGQAMGPCTITNSSFHGTVNAAGEYAGGILAMGYYSTSAPNTQGATIENCYCTGVISGKDKVGGIFGGEAVQAQAWSEADVRNNHFYGTVRTSEGTNVGGIIGYMRSLNRYNRIENNYYREGCGAVRGIGGVLYVDTDAVERGWTASGSTYYMNTSVDSLKLIKEETDPEGRFTSISKTDMNREDDPLGVDADRLAKAMSDARFADGTVRNSLNEETSSLHNWLQGDGYPVHSSVPIVYKLEVVGEYKTEYRIGEELDLTGLILTGVWSDGSTSQLAPDDLEINGYDPSRQGEQTVTILFQSASAQLNVIVRAPEQTISVVVSILGDRLHDSVADGEIHTLSGGNLEKWVDELVLTVASDATVKDALEMALAANDMTYSNPTGSYVESITRNGIVLAQLSNGAASGWMYTLNGKYPELGMHQQSLKNGDIIVLHYTDDYSKEYYGPSQEENPGESKNAETVYRETGDYLETQGTPGVGSIGGEWMALGLLRSDRELAKDYYKNAAQYIQENINDQERLHASKSTENARMILALTAAGYDVSNIEGHNLLKGLTEMSYLCKQGVNGPIWALIAFECHDYKIPAGGDVSRERLIAYILSEQYESGGWALSGEEADPDVTAMAIAALAPYVPSNADVKAALEKAIECLSDMQNEDGSFGSWEVVNSESCAQVIVALTSVGVNPATDPRFIKNGRSVVDALCSFATEDGGFAHSSGGERDAMATEQGYCALSAYFRFLNGKTALYDMSDVVLKTGTADKPDKPGAPSTGDDRPVGGYAVLLMVGILGAAAISVLKKHGEKADI